MAGWYFAGPDSESATDFERNELSRQINTILSRLGSGWMIQVEAVRIPTSTILLRRIAVISPMLSRE
jgi:type IV secretory pathway VirB4 component